MESVTVQVLLTELETARESLDRAFACLVPSIFTEAPDNEELVSGKGAPRNPIIKVVTENGFSIERVCEREELTIESISECHFVVSGPSHEERRVIVAFREDTKRLMQRSQRSTNLPLNSAVWVRCAERHLAAYLWEKNDYPPEGRLIVDAP